MPTVAWVLLGIVGYALFVMLVVAFFAGVKRADEVEAGIRSSWPNR